jgi:hypothetical protein
LQFAYALEFGVRKQQFIIARSRETQIDRGIDARTGQVAREGNFSVRNRGCFFGHDGVERRGTIDRNRGDDGERTAFFTRTCRAEEPLRFSCRGKVVNRPALRRAGAERAREPRERIE